MEQTTTIVSEINISLFLLYESLETLNERFGFCDSKTCQIPKKYVSKINKMTNELAELLFPIPEEISNSYAGTDEKWVVTRYFEKEKWTK